MTKKKAQKTSKRSRKSGVKDLEPKANPKGGLNFTTERLGGTPIENPAALKIQLERFK